MRFYASLVLAGSLLLMLGSTAAHHQTVWTEAAVPLEANSTGQRLHMADNSGKPWHRGSGRREMYEWVMRSHQLG